MVIPRAYWCYKYARRGEAFAGTPELSLKYPEGRAPVLEALTLKIESGEKIALVGSNGAGKSTLMRLLCGLLKASEGEEGFTGGRTGDETSQEAERESGHHLPKSRSAAIYPHSMGRRWPLGYTIRASEEQS